MERITFGADRRPEGLRLPRKAAVVTTDLQVPPLTAISSFGCFDAPIERLQRPTILVKPNALQSLLIVKNLGLPEAQRDWKEVEDLLGQTAQLLPEAPEVPVLRAHLLANYKVSTGQGASLIIE